MTLHGRMGRGISTGLCVGTMLPGRFIGRLRGSAGWQRRLTCQDPPMWLGSAQRMASETQPGWARPALCQQSRPS